MPNSQFPILIGWEFRIEHWSDPMPRSCVGKVSSSIRHSESECSATAEECVRGGISQKLTGNRSDQCSILNSQYLSDGNSELSIGQIHCPVLSWLRYRLQYVIQNRNALQRRRSAFGAG